MHQEVLLAYFSNPGIQVHSSSSRQYPGTHSAAAAPRAAGPAQGRAGLALRAGGGRRVGGSQGAAVQLQVTTEVIMRLLFCCCSPETVALYNAVTSETVAAISAVKSWGLLATLAVLWWSLALVLPPLCIGQVWSPVSC